MKVLITGGATQEPIDRVRFITNFSTGETSALLARVLALRGHDVTLLCGTGALSASGAPVRHVRFTDFQDLERKLQNELQDGTFAAVIHAAAVSDYSVRDVEIDGRVFAAGSVGKIDSRAGQVTLRLRRNHKLLERLKSYSQNSDLKVVGFKLTDTPDAGERQRAIRHLGETGTVDWVVHNDFSDITEGRRIFTLYRVTASGMEKDCSCSSREELGVTLEKRLQG